MKYTSVLLLLSLSFNLFSQEFPTEISVQYGPETGISVFPPKLAFRTADEGVFWGGFVSVNIISVASISVGAVVGYRFRGIAGETSLGFTVVSGKRDGKNEPAIFQAALNPKIIIGHRAFAGFGPGIYLFKSKKRSNSLWDDAGRFNFELGYSENLRF